MPVEVKICGLTRRGDVQAAAQAGAAYVGVVLVGGPRSQTPEAAAELLRGLEGARAAVVVPNGPAARGLVERVRGSARLDVVQLHGEGAAAPAIASAVEVWRVVALSAVGAATTRLFRVDEAVVLDTASSTGLGGTGRRFDWSGAARWLDAVGRPRRLIVAGGLTPENVSEAVRILRPDVVDVSSGVETAPGVKDLTLMRRFLEAAWSA